MAAGWLRYPTIHGDRVVFCTEDDLWSVPLAGGIARRLTTGLGACARPRFSPDGRQIAFDGTEEGVREVYVVDAEGGAVRRLTWQGDAANVVGWSDAGEVLYTSAVGQPFPRDTHAYRIGTGGGGQAVRLPFGPVASVVRSRSGQTALSRHVSDLAWWKRYRGGRMGVLWVRDTDSTPFRVLPIDANVASPMWIGDRLWFVADPGAAPQLHSARVAGGVLEDLRAHTDHPDLAVRFPSTDGTTIVYTHGGDLYRLDPRSDDAPVRIDVDVRSQRTERQRRFPQVVRNLETWDLHPEGHSLAMIVRGRPVVCGNWEGPVEQLGAREGIRYRMARWLDGDRLIVTSDAGGEEALEILPTDRTEGRRFEGLDHGRITEMEVDPTGKRVAFTDHRHVLCVLDPATGEIRTLDRSRAGPIAGFDWSSDGRWLTWARPEGPGHRSRVRLCDVRDGGEPVDVTNGWYRDVAPSFDPDGHHLYLLSFREFDPVADSQYSGYGFPRGMRPYVVTLSADAHDPFRPDPRPLKSPPRTERGPVEIDLEGLCDRIVPFPVPEGRYEQIVGVGSGQVLLTRSPVRGMLDRTWYEPGPPKAEAQLLLWEFDKQELTDLNGRVSSFRVDRRRDHVAVRSGPKLRVTQARPDKGQRDELRKTEGRTDRKSGWIDLGRVRVSVDPTAEWSQILREAWRLMRDHYWNADLNGVDWQAVHDRYRPLLDRIGTRGELSDLVWCMQGELGTSHAYEMGGDYVPPPTWRIGRLGADFEWDAAVGCWRIARIVRGEPGDPDRSSPLLAPGARIEVGDLITHVAGVPTDADTAPEVPLVNQGGSPVSVRVRTAGGSRDVVIRTLADDRNLRYREWVLDNQRKTHAASDGRIGYVHVPDMGTPGFAEFHRDFQRESERDALLVDVRHNRGGHVSQLLLDRLGRRRIGYKVPRWVDPSPYPAYSVPGPMVALTNEMAGSDGDIFSHAWKRLGLGTLVGTRTWGGVVGIWPRQLLIDRAVTTQPEYATWFDDVGFAVENYGTDPDVVVDRTPDDWITGRDAPLERAWSVLLAALVDHPPGPLAP